MTDLSKYFGTLRLPRNPVCSAIWSKTCPSNIETFDYWPGLDCVQGEQGNVHSDARGSPRGQGHQEARLLCCHRHSVNSKISSFDRGLSWHCTVCSLLYLSHTHSAFLVCFNNLKQTSSLADIWFGQFCKNVVFHYNKTPDWSSIWTSPRLLPP